MLQIFQKRLLCVHKSEPKDELEENNFATKKGATAPFITFFI